MMNMDNFDRKSFESTFDDVKSKLKTLREGIEKGLSPENERTIYMSDVVVKNPFTEITAEESGMDSSMWTATVREALKKLYHGYELPDGGLTLGLDELSKKKLDPDHMYEDLKQQSGIAAEIISTAKENLEAKLLGKDQTTYRADDRPDLLQETDPDIDKIRVDNNTGEILERIKTAFVGKNAKECLSELTGDEYEKYFNDDSVDKVEIPKELYNKIKDKVSDKLSKLSEDLSRAENDSDTREAEAIKKEISQYKTIDSKTEKSNTTSEEAIFARLEPRRYIGRMAGIDAVIEANAEAVGPALHDAGIAFAQSLNENIPEIMDGKITAQEAMVDAVTDSAKAGFKTYTTVFVDSLTHAEMAPSSRSLIKSFSVPDIPGIDTNWGIDTYNSIMSCAKGEISVSELSYNMSELAVHIDDIKHIAEVSSHVGAVVGAGVGAALPGVTSTTGAAVGATVGYGVGVVGGIVVYTVAAEAHAAAVQIGSEKADILAEQAKKAADNTIRLIKENAPDKVDAALQAVNDYASKFKLPFRVELSA